MFSSSFHFKKCVRKKEDVFESKFSKNTQKKVKSQELKKISQSCNTKKNLRCLTRIEMDYDFRREHYLKYPPPIKISTAQINFWFPKSFETPKLATFGECVKMIKIFPYLITLVYQTPLKMNFTILGHIGASSIISDFSRPF